MPGWRAGNDGYIPAATVRQEHGGSAGADQYVSEIPAEASVQADGGGVARPVRNSRLGVGYLPGCVPELEPNEYGWSYPECDPPANYCRGDEQLADRVGATADKGVPINNPCLVRSLMPHSCLSSHADTRYLCGNE